MRNSASCWLLLQEILTILCRHNVDYNTFISTFTHVSLMHISYKAIDKYVKAV
jgi:hypothetical protein